MSRACKTSLLFAPLIIELITNTCMPSSLPVILTRGHLLLGIGIQPVYVSQKVLYCHKDAIIRL